MSKKPGQMLLIQKPPLVGGGEFIDYCGFRSRTFSISPSLIDESSDGCENPGELPDVERVYGLMDHSFSGSGRYCDGVNGRDIALAAERREILEGWRVIVPGFGIYTGDWAVGNYVFTGEEVGSMTFTCDISQSTPPVFAAEV